MSNNELSSWTVIIKYALAGGSSVIFSIAFLASFRIVSASFIQYTTLSLTVYAVFITSRISSTLIPDNANSALRLSAIKCDKVVLPLPLSPTRTINLGNLSILILFILLIKFF